MKSRADRYHRTVRTAILALAAAGTLAAASLSGTWKLDPARSRLDPPTRLIWEPNGVKAYKHTNPNLKAVAWPVDGTPVLSPTEEDVLVSRKRLNERLIEEVRTKAGKPISKATYTVSADGRRLTIAGRGVNSEGDKFDYTTPYTRVGVPGRDPFAGTWEEDFFAQVREPILVTIQDSAKQFGVTGKGYTWSAAFSGMQSTVKLPWADHAFVQRTGDGQVKVQLTKSSRVTRDEEYTLSKDGQTLVIRRKLPGAKPTRGYVETYTRTSR